MSGTGAGDSPGKLRRAAALLTEMYAAPYRRTLARARQDEDDLFMVMVLSEALGIANPASAYTIELLPVIYEEIHAWHQRMGLDRSPLEHFSCC
ncbi:MAG: DNA helicase [Micrococcales bacterium]|nr:MAG: DNA helicase [Micrococcales bacterium]